MIMYDTGMDSRMISDVHVYLVSKSGAGLRRPITTPRHRSSPAKTRPKILYD